MASLPQPPEDVELKNIIDKLAQFVARNGPEFENMTKEKQRDNAKFGFLFGGEYFNYYQYRVTTEQIIQKQQAQKASSSDFMQAKVAQLKQLEAELQQKTLQVAEQIKQSEQNLHAHEKAISQQQQTDIDEAIVSVRAQRVQQAAIECNVDLNELESVLEPLRTSCTKDAIQNAKSWVLINVLDSQRGEFFSAFLLNRVFTTDITFESRLHLTYLINDIMHHCTRKGLESLRRSMENVVVPIFCVASCQASMEQSSKLQKLLGIWEQHKYFINEILEALRNPQEGYSRYQADLITKYADVVTRITQEGRDRLTSLTQQHQEFSNHLNNQLRALQQQYEQLKHDVMMGPGPMKSRPPGQSGLNTGHAYPTPGSITVPPPALYSQPPPATAGGPSAAGQPPPGPLLPFDPSQPPPAVFSQPPPGFPPGGPPVRPTLAAPPPMDLKRPPPGFPTPTPAEDLIPMAPYYDLPAGLIVPLVKLKDIDYKPIDPRDIRLPPPAPPTDRLLQAVESFYTPPSHECPIDAEGWEKLGLYEYYKAKNEQKKKILEERQMREKEARRFREEGRNRSRSKSGSRSNSPSESPERRRRSASPAPYKRSSRSRTPPSRSSRRHSRSKSKSKSPPPYRRSSRSASRSPSPARRRGGAVDRRSPTPDDLPVLGMYAPPGLEMPLTMENKGAQLLHKMGWSGGGLGASEQGMVDPVKAAEVRGASDMYRGIGMDMNDPFEQFRKNKASGFIEKLKARDDKVIPSKAKREGD